MGCLACDDALASWQTNGADARLAGWPGGAGLASLSQRIETTLTLLQFLLGQRPLAPAARVGHTGAMATPCHSWVPVARTAAAVALALFGACAGPPGVTATDAGQAWRLVCPWALAGAWAGPGALVAAPVFGGGILRKSSMALSSCSGVAG